MEETSIPNWREPGDQPRWLCNSEGVSYYKRGNGELVVQVMVDANFIENYQQWTRPLKVEYLNAFGG